MKSHRHILSKRAQMLHMDRLKGQGHLISPKSYTTSKSPVLAPTLLKNIADGARRRVLRAASRLKSLYKK